MKLAELDRTVLLLGHFEDQRGSNISRKQQWMSTHDEMSFY